MKKMLLCLLLVILFITGCGVKSNNSSNKKGAEASGRMYELISLTDKGINMFNSVVPEGWTSSIYSQNLVNSSHPFMEPVILTNQDETARIIILSQHSYVENKNYNEGQNEQYYTTYLHQMDASTYLDYFMDKIYPGVAFVQNGVVEDELFNELNTFQELRVNLAKQEASQLQADQYGVYISIGDEGVTSAKKEYQNGDSYYEASTSVLAVSTTLRSSLSSLLDSKSIFWYMPYLIIFEANSKEAFDAYYEDYNFIVANSSFTTDYYAMVEYVSGAIENAYSSIYAERSKASLQAMNDYIDSNYTSTSSQSTNDKVMEMWDDVIKEVDKYQLEDGSYIKTSIMNDTVAQNGNEIYIGDKAGIPYGFNEVSKGY